MTGFNKQLQMDVIKQAQVGDQFAMEQIYRTYCNATYTLAFRICYNRISAEDITQEAFIKVFKNIANYAFDGNFAGWIRKIVVNEAINFNKSKFNQVMDLEDDLDTGFENSIFNCEWVINTNEIEYYLSLLSELARTVLILHQVEGYTHNEIAEMLGKTESFSKMTLLRAFRTIHDEIKSQERHYALK